MQFCEWLSSRNMPYKIKVTSNMTKPVGFVIPCHARSINYLTYAEQVRNAIFNKDVLLSYQVCTVFSI